MIFGQCHSAENCKRGTFWCFLTSIVLQNNETNEGDPLVQSKKFKKRCIVPKKVGLKGIRVLFLLFVLDALLRFECFEPP